MSRRTWSSTRCTPRNRIELPSKGRYHSGRRYDFDEAHGVHVGKLAVSIFDQLTGRHELGEDDRRILVAGSVLHDIGVFVSYKKHHKHSLYILQHSEIADFSPRELLMVANVARYHRKGPPEDFHEDYMRLGVDEQKRVKKLASILRLADALDREHLQRVTDVTATVTDDALVLTVHASGDLALERWALAKKADLFEDVFDLDVTLTVTDEALAETI